MQTNPRGATLTPIGRGVVLITEHNQKSSRVEASGATTV